MSVFSKYRRNMSVDWGIDTENYPFVKCSDQPLDVQIPIFGFFVTPDSGYGEGPIVSLENSLLSLPQRYLEQIKDFMDDPDVVEAVKAHKTAIVISTFVSKKYKKTGYDIDFIELEQ